jgi:hypothetical protein
MIPQKVRDVPGIACVAEVDAGTIEASLSDHPNLFFE